MNRKAYFRYISIVLLLCLLLNSYTIHASSEEGVLTVGQSSIINGGFEYPNLKAEDTKNDGWKGIEYNNSNYETQKLSWKTTATDRTLEYAWLKNTTVITEMSPHMKPTVENVIVGNGPSDGVQFAEVVANEVSSLYQILSVESGENYSWTVHHRGRKGVDTLAFIITDEDASVNYVKSSKTGTDHFQQIINWLKSKGITAPVAGNTAEHTVYTTKLNDSNSFEAAADGSFFSFTKDGEHTVEFKICLMSTAKADWGEYTGSYYSGANKNIMFVLTPFSTSFGSSSGGNLLDNMSFADKSGRNLLINAGFDDVPISRSYASLKAANYSSPEAGIGWCTTAWDYYVEVGNTQHGDAYGLGSTVEIVTSCKPSIREGQQFVELNANEESSLYQIVDTTPGKMYRWGLSHRGRSGKDTMALIIGPDQTSAPQKTSPTERDQLMKMVDWLYSQTDVALDIPTMGCSNEIKIYTPKFNNSGGFQYSGDSISWQSDENHTEEWSIWIISSLNDDWHDYGDYEKKAAYNYNYIVPQGQEKTIFGFVSVNAVDASGTSKKTYGNLLDNIEFEEFYYVNADFNKSPVEEYGTVYITPEVPGTFEPDDNTNDTGWVLAGSNISIYYKPGNRTFIGGYINGEFVPADRWIKEEVDGKTEYRYDFKNVNSSITVDIIYQAQNVIYDSCNQYEYHYDLNDPTTRCEIPLDEHSSEYISHAPEADDGWKFMGWKYISTNESEIKSYMLEAKHKVKYYKENENEFLSIYEILSESTEQLVVDKIPEIEGITFFAQWKYRQRVIAQTFDEALSSYKDDTEGGTVEVKLLQTDDENPEIATDYTPNGESEAVGQQLYASAGDTYIGVTAKNKIGYLFSGWYDESGALVTRNPTYSYKVKDGDVTQLYAHFDPIGFDVTLNTNVIGNTEDEGKYFAINCTFSELRENQIYAITGLPNNANITVNGETKVNPTNIKADENGKVNITLYMKKGNSATLLHLPAGAVYSVTADASTKRGFSVRGEITNETLTAVKTVDLFFYKVNQFVSFDYGKHYEGIVSQQSPQEITITKNSSYTLDVETQYTPKIYNGLNISLCFYSSDGSAKEFFTGTRILMLDLSNQNEPKYYSYTVNGSVSVIDLTQFTELGSADAHFALKTGEMLTEKLVFIVDYVGTNDANSAEIALVYSDNDDELTNILTPPKKAVKIGTDTTKLTAVGNGNTSSDGPFAINITVGESAPAVNTTYEGGESGKYAVKLSVDGGNLPDGSYAVVDGKTYYSNNGYIKISPITPGSFNVNIYSPVPLEPSDGKVKFTATLLSAVSTSAIIPVEIIKTPIEYSCVDVAIDAEVLNKVLSPGNVSSAKITLKHNNLDEVKLTVSQKNSDGTYIEILTDVNVNLPADDAEFTVDLSNGFNAQSGKTYIFSFAGYVGGFPVCKDNCCVVCGYVLKNN
ncbi:MAG: hypothetical protein ACI4I4_07160 [Acutalibacteraceae bacterium]